MSAGTKASADGRAFGVRRAAYALGAVALATLGACGAAPETPEEGASFNRRDAATVAYATDDAAPLDCTSYCAVLMRRCRDATRQFASMQACAARCADYPTDGALGAIAGDSLQCRFTFALAARKTTRHSFCRNAGPTGGVACK